MNQPIASWYAALADDKDGLENSFTNQSIVKNWHKMCHKYQLDGFFCYRKIGRNFRLKQPSFLENGNCKKNVYSKNIKNFTKKYRTNVKWALQSKYACFETC